MDLKQQVKQELEKCGRITIENNVDLSDSGNDYESLKYV